MGGLAIGARVVAAETLDGLAESDPAAQRSRRDLRRIHRAMGTRSIVRRGLEDLLGSKERSASAARRPLRVLELGAGDGTLLLGVAGALGSRWPAVELTLLDRQSLVEPSTVEAYAACGWRVTPRVVDVFAWARSAGADPALPAASMPTGAPTRPEPTPPWDLIVGNLFLHHFEGPALSTLLAAIEAQGARFFACEPRRATLAWIGSHLVGALGANAVTREDAVLSVQAGFRDRELSALWPQHARRWRLREYPAGLFSHCLQAQRVDPDDAVTPVR